MIAKLAKAFDGGAQHKRGGISADRTMQNFFSDAEKAYALFGWRTQQAHPKDRVISSFFLEHRHCKVCAANMAQPKETTVPIRTAEELEALKASYRADAYDAYAAEQTEQGFEPQSFDDAFAAHLAALDADGTNFAGLADSGKTDTPPAAEKPAKPVKAPKAPKEPKAPKAAKEPAAPKEPKAKKFRPTSADRATIMAAAGKLTKDETPRMKLASGDPYVNFLKGIDTDANGNAEVLLDVFTAKAARAADGAAIGKLKVTITKGELKKVVKA